MPTKEFIVSEIRKVAEKLGRPPGRAVFEKQTGIRTPEWYGVHWRSWGEALEEAGFKPNRKQEKLSSQKVLEKYAEAVRHFGRIPAEIDIRLKHIGIGVLAIVVQMENGSSSPKMTSEPLSGASFNRLPRKGRLAKARKVC